MRWRPFGKPRTEQHGKMTTISPVRRGVIGDAPGVASMLEVEIWFAMDGAESVEAERRARLTLSEDEARKLYARLRGVFEVGL